MTLDKFEEILRKRNADKLFQLQVVVESELNQHNIWDYNDDYDTGWYNALEWVVEMMTNPDVLEKEYNEIKHFLAMLPE